MNNFINDKISNELQTEYSSFAFIVRKERKEDIDYSGYFDERGEGWAFLHAARDF